MRCAVSFVCVVYDCILTCVSVCLCVFACVCCYANNTKRHHTLNCVSALALRLFRRLTQISLLLLSSCCFFFFFITFLSTLHAECLYRYSIIYICTNKHKPFHAAESGCSSACYAQARARARSISPSQRKVAESQLTTTTATKRTRKATGNGTSLVVRKVVSCYALAARRRSVK